MGICSHRNGDQNMWSIEYFLRYKIFEFCPTLLIKSGFTIGLIFKMFDSNKMMLGQNPRSVRNMDWTYYGRVSNRSVFGLNSIWKIGLSHFIIYNHLK